MKRNVFFSLVIAIFAFSFAGCMNLFDKTEVATAWTDEGGITIDVEYFVDMDLFKPQKSGNIVTFTASADHTSYTWWISNKDDSVGNEKSYEWDTSVEADGQYYVTLVVTESDSTTKSATLVVNVHKD